MFPNSTNIRISLFLLMLFMGLAQLGTSQTKTVNTPLVKKGFIDLSKSNLDQTPVSITGEWGIYWEKLLTESDTNSIPTAYTYFPNHWNNTIINGKSLPAKGFASHTVRVIVNSKQQHHLAIKLPDTYCSFQLLVNGKPLANAGVPGTNKESTREQWLEQVVALPSVDTLDLILQIANFRHSKGGPYKPILIGNHQLLQSDKAAEDGFDLLLAGALLMGGLFFIGLFYFGKHDKVILFFSLFCIAYSYRIIGSDNYVLHSLFPHFPWIIGVHLEYLSLFISVIFFMFYTKYLFPDETNKWLLYVEASLATLLCLTVIIFPPSIFTQLINPFLIVMFTVIGHAFYIYIKAYVNKKLGAKYALLSTGILLIIFLLINLKYFNIIQPPRFVLFFGYLSFFFFQSLILSFRFAYILKEAKKEAEQGLKAKNDFLSTMSHEIRTPLNSILGMTNIMLMEKPSEDQKEQLNVLLFSANNLLSIVNDILDYNKIEAGKIGFESIEMDLNNIANKLISGFRTLAKDKGIDLRILIDDQLKSKLIGDPTRTSQIIGNLIHNAIKFTKKGYVELRISVKAQDATSVRLLIEIEDTGIGIAQEKQQLIFDQFTQADNSTSRNFGGTGLGLAISKKLLELQGSSLQLKSEPDNGSVFYFEINYPIFAPVSKEKEIEISLAPTEDSKPLTGMSILLVEDNEVNILVAKTFLGKWGATVDIAQNGQEAVDLFNPTIHQIILMDMHMPVMDGYEATRILRDRGVTTPIIALTASLPREIEDRIKSTGINDIVVKPFIPAELFKLILHYTGIHRL
ncbi:ATP-binding protein [Sediminibacterium sp.]|uniref:ATP-binding protein n=1 Tax=Sediminibacterium sp. TaxID=1917865 RepID=UPI002734F5AB|nr:ATP-binding protein [Sediminibacterium sp.]MDP3394675.1 ATP-binding protein [Sediminibacterium sp.]MDP3568510.1 ATP-binding protein [Sediminibacterium sp.]